MIAIVDNRTDALDNGSRGMGGMTSSSNNAHARTGARVVTPETASHNSSPPARNSRRRAEFLALVEQRSGAPKRLLPVVKHEDQRGQRSQSRKQHGNSASAQRPPTDKQNAESSPAPSSSADAGSSRERRSNAGSEVANRTWRDTTALRRVRLRRETGGLGRHRSRTRSRFSTVADRRCSALDGRTCPRSS